MLKGEMLPKLAFLGPMGTYSHQASYDIFATSVQYCEKATITDVFNALSPDVPLAVIPKENSTFGSVIETDDLLRLPAAGKDIFVVGETVLAIRHCLIVRKGVKLEDIKTVLSHEQALGQCRNFISKNIPGASIVKVASTGAAAKALLSPPTNDRNPFQCAAICSKMIATIFEGLEVLRENIQDAEANSTRFYILSTCLKVQNIPPPKTKSTKRALVRLSSSLDTQSSVAPTIIRLLCALELSAIRIDRRPSPYPVPFHDVYIVELQQEVGDHSDCDRSWLCEVEASLQKARNIGGETVLVGIW